MNRLLKSFFPIILLISLGGSVVSIPVSASLPVGEPESAKGMAFQDAMRKLWEDHITWTRVFIISAAADLPDKEAATNRLLPAFGEIQIGEKEFGGFSTDPTLERSPYGKSCKHWWTPCPPDDHSIPNRALGLLACC
jgi:hypothetical protein